MGEPRRESVGSVRPESHVAHSAHLHDALEDALANASGTIGTGQDIHVDVHLEAGIHADESRVGEYRVVLRPR